MKTEQINNDLILTDVDHFNLKRHLNVVSALDGMK